MNASVIITDSLHCNCPTLVEGVAGGAEPWMSSVSVNGVTQKNAGNMYSV